MTLTKVVDIEDSPQGSEREDSAVISNGGSSSNESSVDTIMTTPLANPNFDNSVLNFTPKGSQEWIRKVEAEFTPELRKCFYSLEEAIQFYKVYAIACGFETRLSTTKRFRDKTIKTKCVVCNKEGFKEVKNKTEYQTIKPLKSETKSQKLKITKIRRLGCKAMIKFRYHEGVYIVEKFYEGHNHTLTLAKNREFLKLSRNLTLYHKQTIVNLSKVNIGATKSYRICKENANGYQNIGASLLEFKNFQRDIKCFIGFRDAEMFIGKMRTLSETRKGFYFAYALDGCQNLIRVFWTDAIAKRNYSAFGDAVSFDPTYGTNKYCMVLTPFTGVDNHKKSVTFGAAMLSNEDEESFIWVFKQFLEAMGKKEPQFIITDQDPAIKKAVPKVFETARHRFCMWHIMNKVSVKVDTAICKDTDFLDKINAVVWSTDLEPMEFEEKWAEVIEEFALGDHEWLNYMFEIRDQWIPSYFRDLQMGNILKTTQRSESANNFFKKFESHYGTLVEFWSRYESAMEQQRHTYKRLEMESGHSIPQAISHLSIETHALTVYTHELFYEFQEEVKYSISACGVAGYSKMGDFETTTVEDTTRGKTYIVVYNRVTNESKCTCKLFERRGFVCRHIVWIWSGRRVKEIPPEYIMPRWTKDALRNTRYDFDGTILEDYDVSDSKQLLMSDVWCEIHATVALLARKEESEMKELVKLLKAFRGEIEPPTFLSKQQELEMLLDCTLPEEVTILPPHHSSNKGSGKRLVTSKEKAVKKASKPKRMCKNCKRMGHHDRRNCPNPFAENPPDEEEESESE